MRIGGTFSVRENLQRHTKTFIRNTILHFFLIYYPDIIAARSLVTSKHRPGTEVGVVIEALMIVFSETIDVR